MKRQKQKKNVKKPVILVVLALVVAAGAFFATRWIAEGSKDDNINNTAEVDQKEVSYTGVDEPEPPVIDPDTGLEQVEVRIVSWGVDEDVWVAGEVSDSVDDSGVCTYVFNKDGEEKRLESDAERGPKSVTCMGVTEPANNFKKGTWTVQLEYESEWSIGVSEEVSFEIR